MENQPLINKPKDQTENELQALLFKYLRYWPFILLSVILSAFLAWLYLRYTVPMYEVVSTILIKDDKKGGGGGLSEENVFSDLSMFSSNRNIENEIQILKSRMLMQEVVNKLGLNFSYYTVGRIKTSEAYKSSPVQLNADSLTKEAYGKVFDIHPLPDNKFEIINGDKRTTHEFGTKLTYPWGNLTFTYTGNANVNPDYIYKVAIADPLLVADRYSKALRVGTIVSQSTVLELRLIDESPEKALDILEKLVELYNEAAITDKNRVAAKTLDFLDSRINLLTKELGEVEKGIEHYTTRNEAFNLTDESDKIISQVFDYDKQLSELDIQLNILKGIKEYLSKDAATFEFVPSNLTINNLTLSGLLVQFNQLLSERERMIKSTRGDNPALVTLDNQLRNLRANILRNIEVLNQRPGVVNRIRRHRADLIAAILAGQPEQARDACHEHLAFIEDTLLDIQREELRTQRQTRQVRQHPN